MTKNDAISKEPKKEGLFRSEVNFFALSLWRSMTRNNLRFAIAKNRKNKNANFRYENTRERENGSN